MLQLTKRSRAAAATTAAVLLLLRRSIRGARNRHHHHQHDPRVRRACVRQRRRAYEQVRGTVTGELDPFEPPQRRHYQDIEFAPRNANGKVEYVRLTSSSVD